MPFTDQISLGSIGRRASLLLVMPLARRNSAPGWVSRGRISTLSPDWLNLLPTTARTMDSPKK